MSSATDLKGRVAVVTGAARRRGIGRAIALRLAESGCDVAVLGSPRPTSSFPESERLVGWLGATSVAEEIGDAGGRAIALDLDVTDGAAVRNAVGEVVGEFGKVDILVNNAAAASEAGAASILDMDDDVWLRTVDINLNGVYWMTKAVGREMRAAGAGGSIINVSSTAGRVGVPNYGAYCATKWALIGLTQQLALELARDSIRVNCICPGSTETDMMDGTFSRTAAKFGLDPERPRKAAVSGIPLRRQGRPDEQAAAVAFLASDEAGYITGQTLNVDGGLRMD